MLRAIQSITTLSIHSLVVACGGGDGGSGGSAPAPTSPVDPSLSTVEPLYSSAANWNDYIRNDGAALFNATNTACDGTETGNYSVCLHGGEMRSVTVNEVTSCTGVSAVDSLGIFNWRCDESVSPIRMISFGLKDDKNLSDLLDFTTPAFVENQVTVTLADGSTLATDPSVWWTNPVEIDNDGGDLISEGTIYVATINPTVPYSIITDKVAFIVQPGIDLTAPTGTYVVYVQANNFNWFEGNIVEDGAETGLGIVSSHFSHFRNINIIGDRITSGGLDDSTLLIDSSNSNRLYKVAVANSGQFGIFAHSVNGNIFQNIKAANNEQTGISVQGENNILTDISVFNNGNNGLSYTSGRQIIGNVYAFANNSTGVISYSGDNSFIANSTVSNNQGGIGLFNSDGSGTSSNAAVLKNLLTINNNLGISTGNFSGGAFDGSSGLSIENLALIQNSDRGLRFTNSSNNLFAGELLLEIPAGSIGCDVMGGVQPGVTNTSCANEGRSDAMVNTITNATDDIIGPVLTDDTKNTSDTNGFAAYSAGNDWLGFENTSRAWVYEPIAGSDIGRCDAPNNCRILDASLTSSANQLRNILPLTLNGDADSTITHSWYSATVPTTQAECDATVSGSVFNTDHCETTYLRNSVELLGDFLGNENGLCESGEVCLHTPNIGAYQGHGNLVTAGDFVDGDSLTNITLLQYENNGR